MHICTNKTEEETLDPPEFVMSTLFTNIIKSFYRFMLSFTRKTKTKLKCMHLIKHYTALVYKTYTA